MIAGNRRLAALRDVYKDAARPPKVPCVLAPWTTTPPTPWPWPKTSSASRCTRWTKPMPSPTGARRSQRRRIHRRRVWRQPALCSPADEAGDAGRPVKAAYRQGGIDTAPPRRSLPFRPIGKRKSGRKSAAIRSMRSTSATSSPMRGSTPTATFDVSKLPEWGRQPRPVHRARAGGTQGVHGSPGRGVFDRAAKAD